MTTSIYPVLLAGGSGSRLWPVSRRSFPKQFSNLIGTHSLFQNSILRFQSSKKITFSPCVTLTNNDFRFVVENQFEQIGIHSGDIIVEPTIRNTAPSILAAALHCEQKNSDALLIVSPSDHQIDHIDGFHDSILAGIPKAQEGNFVTFGVQPDYPETGYGYLEISQIKKFEPMEVLRFIEKPSLDCAKKLVATRNHLWNSGIYLFRAKDLIFAFKKYAPDILRNVRASFELKNKQGSITFLEEGNWSSCENVSIDYAIMEKSENLSVIPLSSGWSDLGTWDSIWKNSKSDENGVVLKGKTKAINCKNSLIYSEDDRMTLVGVGVEDIIAVAMSDAVLLAKKGRSQDVKMAIDLLNKEESKLTIEFNKTNRPWGWFKTIFQGQNFKVKQIYVNPSASLSLQSHKHRLEHWVVVKGTAHVKICDKEIDLYKGESTFIPKGSIHRLENFTDDELILIEVQIGSYLGEDDIIRYEDKYNRK